MACEAKVVGLLAPYRILVRWNLLTLVVQCASSCLPEERFAAFHLTSHPALEEALAVDLHGGMRLLPPSSSPIAMPGGQLRSLERVQALQNRVDSGEDFEVVSSVAPSAADPSPSASTPTTAAVAAGTDLSSERVAVAEQIGQWIRRGLNQQNRGLSGREKAPAEPELLEPRSIAICSGEEVEFEYQSAVFVSVSTEPSTHTSCSLVAVAEVDGQVLVAVPAAAWHKTRKKRAVNPDFLKKAIAVLVPCCGADRAAPQTGPDTKVWLGLLAASAESQVYSDEGQAEITFPVDEHGLVMLPYAAALVAAARDHFTFMSAESAGQPVRPPGLSKDPAGARLAALEEELARLRQEVAGGKASVMKAAPKQRQRAERQELPAGIDPGVAQQALQAGVTPAALQEMAVAMGLPRPEPKGVAVEDELSEEEAEQPVLEADLGLGKGCGSADPVALAVVQLTKLVADLHQTKVVKQDKKLENILDRAEYGYAKEPSSSSGRSKSAALLSLQRLLRSDPKLIYTSIEARLQEDWEQASMQPGMNQQVISARGWIEHRSRIQAYPTTVRAAWALGGIWDCLRTGRIEEARARTALSVCVLDRQACDAGSWLLASELALESPPPMTNFQMHQAPHPWELPHSKLVDPRWMDLVVAKVKDLADYHEKRAKLGSSYSKPKTEESAPAAKPKPKAKAKGNGKGKTSSSDDSKDTKDKESKEQAA
eukprot:s684_g2.t1